MCGRGALRVRLVTQLPTRVLSPGCCAAHGRWLGRRTAPLPAGPHRHRHRPHGGNPLAAYPASRAPFTKTPDLSSFSPLPLASLVARLRFPSHSVFLRTQPKRYTTTSTRGPITWSAGTARAFSRLLASPPQAAIAVALAVPPEGVLRNAPLRENLRLSVSTELPNARERSLQQMLQLPPYKSMKAVIVYCTYQRTADQLAAALYQVNTPRISHGEVGERGWNWKQGASSGFCVGERIRPR